MNFYEEQENNREQVMLITETGERLTYRQVYKLAAEMLHSVPGGALVFLFCKNQPESIAGYLGMLQKGIVPALLDPGLEKDQIRELLRRYRPEYCLYPEAVREKFTDMEILWDNGHYRLSKTGETPDRVFHPDLALLLSTSGSTGSPKMVRLSRKNLQSNARSIGEYLEITREDRAVTSLPMQYTYGLSVINSHVERGAALLLTDRTVFEKEFWEFVKKERATSMAGVPRTYEMLKMLRIHQMDLPDLKVLTQAGGHLTAQLQEYYGTWCADKKIRFYIMYGQTEATARMSYLPWQKILEKPGSIGIPIPGGRFALADEEGKLIEGAGQEGELIYYGDNVSMGYAACRGDLEKGDERRGCLHTGDLAKRDTEGFYYITGRKKRFLKVFGMRVSLDMLEEIIKKQYPDRDAACTGMDDRAAVFIEKKPEDREAELEEEIRNFLSARTRLHRSAFSVRFVSRIPRNSSGKVQYAQLEKQL